MTTSYSATSPIEETMIAVTLQRKQKLPWINVSVYAVSLRKKGLSRNRKMPRIELAPMWDSPKIPIDLNYVMI